MVTRSRVKFCVMIGCHKVGGQGRWSRSGYRSWGQVGGGVKVWVKVVVKVGVKVRGQDQGHDQWSQGLGSRSGVNIRGQGQWSGQGHGEGVNVWRIGVRWSVGVV